MDHANTTIEAADNMPPNIQTTLDEVLPFEEAVSSLKGRIPLSKKEWSALEPKLRFRAFTVAKLAQCDYIEAVRGRLISALSNGDGFAGSWADVKSIAKEDGSFDWKPGYWETVFRTNIQSCYVSGRLMQYEKTNPPAFQLIVIDDDRTTEICHALLNSSGNGIAMPKDHPFWQKYGYPPYHYGCRTSIRAVRKSEIGKTIQVENPTMTSLHKRFKPMSGFGGNPIEKESWWKLPNSMIDRAQKYGIQTEIENFAKSLGLHNYNLDLVNGTNTRRLEKTSFYAEKASNAQPKQHEVKMAKLLTEKGHSVLFTPVNTVDSVKNYDAIIDNKVAEFKRITSKSIDKITDRLLEAAEQGSQIVCIETPIDQYQKSAAMKIIHQTLLNEKASGIDYVYLIWGDSLSIIKK